MHVELDSVDYEGVLAQNLASLDPSNENMIVGAGDEWIVLNGAAALIPVVFGGLTPAANKMIYFTGADAAALQTTQAGGRDLLTLAGTADTIPYFNGLANANETQVTAYIRSLFQATDAAAARVVLGVTSLDGDDLGDIQAERLTMLDPLKGIDSEAGEALKLYGGPYDGGGPNIQLGPVANSVSLIATLIGFTGDVTITSGNLIHSSANSGLLDFAGGGIAANGGLLKLYGGSHATYPDEVHITADPLLVTGDIKLAANSDLITTSTGGIIANGGTLYLAGGNSITTGAQLKLGGTGDEIVQVHSGKTSGSFRAGGGNTTTDGGYIKLYGSTHASFPSEVVIGGNLLSLNVTDEFTIRPGSSDDSFTQIFGDNAMETGITIYGKNHATLADQIHLEGGVVFTHADKHIHTDETNESLRVSGGSSYNLGGRMELFGESHATKAGEIHIHGPVEINSVLGLKIQETSDCTVLATDSAGHSPALKWNETQGAWQLDEPLWLGAQAGEMGSLTLFSKTGGGLAPAYIYLASESGNGYYFFVSNAGQLRYKSITLPAEGDGAPVGDRVHRHGSMGIPFVDGGAVAIVANASWEDVKPVTIELEHNFTGNAANGSLTVDTDSDGDYFVAWSATISGGNANEIRMGISINDATPVMITATKFSAANTQEPISGCCAAVLAVGDIITLQCYNETGVTAIDVWGACIRVFEG